MQFPNSKPPSQIPKTLHLYPEYHLKKKIFNSHDPNNPRFSSAAAQLSLSKYFPKYYNHLEIDYRRVTHAVILKVKQVKTTNHFLYNSLPSLYEQNHLTKLQKFLLQTKRKSLKSLPKLGDKWYCYYCQFSRLSLFFPNIISLDISRNFARYHRPEIIPFTSTSLEKSLIKFYGSFWEASRKLQHLKLPVFISDFGLLFDKINESKRFLTALKTFKITFHIFKEASKTEIPRMIFQALLKNPDLLRHLTHLSFESFENLHYFGSLIKEILEKTPRLTSLSFPLDKQFYDSQEGHHSRNNLTLAPLKSLQNIQALKLDVWNIVGFLQVFEFPFKLHTLDLDFSPFNYFSNIWDSYFPSPDDLIDSNKQKIVQHFFNRFQQLSWLTTLNLTMAEFFTQKDFDKFLFPLIGNIPNLSKLVLKFSQSYLDFDTSLNLSHLLSGITSIKTLKSLEFLHKLIVFDPNKGVIISTDSQFSFSNITSLKINTRISEDSYKDFLQQTFQLPEESAEAKRDFHLGVFCLTSVKTFSELIKILNRLIPEWKMMKISIEIELVICSIQDLEETFSFPVQVKNASVTLFIVFKGKSLARKDLQYCQRIFKSFALDIVQPVVGKDYKYIMKNGIVSNAYSVVE